MDNYCPAVFKIFERIEELTIDKGSGFQLLIALLLLMLDLNYSMLLTYVFGLTNSS